MKKKANKRFVWILIVVMTAVLTACGKKTVDISTENTANVATTDTTEVANTETNETPTVDANSEKSVNIGVTDVLSSLNPLLEDGTEVVKYATSLSYLPLVELNKNLEFEGQIASSITTEDNIHFTINIDDKATWSDGEPVTSADVLFSFQLWASPEVGNTGLSIFKIEGVGDDGYVKAGVDTISGVVAIDEKTVEVTAKAAMALYAFENTYGRYILPLPKHILGDIPKEELLTNEWFNAPTVVSGPYFIKKFDLNHYVNFVGNENYWKGAPKIKNLNIQIVTASQLLTGLQSGEIDLVQQTMGAVLQEDDESIRALDNITVYDGTPITNQSIFINTANITDIRVRQAILYGIDRQTILSEIMGGKGEIVDAFLASAGPYYDSSLAPTVYNPEKAKALIAEAVADGFDASKEYSFYVNSGDTTFVQVASYFSAQLAEIGLKLKINTVDISTLMSAAGNGEFDVMAVQYTYTPVDPYTDVEWLLSKTGWTRYSKAEITDALAKTQITSDIEEIKAQYLIIDKYVQEEVPMISAYIISAIGATSNHLKNAVPDVYGTFINVQNWDIVE